MALATMILASGLPSPGRAQPQAPPPSSAKPDSSTAPDFFAGPDSLAAPGTSATPDSSAPPDSLADPGKNFTRAALEVTGVNVGIWLYCRYIREGGTNTGFRIGIQSWKENLLNGFEWDDNQFPTNQFAHPYHGSMYFCSARANGFDFWESIPFNFAGSAMWEYFGETHHPSINDWISTSVGGIALGEILHRFSAMVLDQEATGRRRTWREIGGLVGRSVVALESDVYHLRIMNGTEARHLVTENRVTVGLPLKGPLGIGAEYSVYHAERDYADFPDVSQRNPQLTTYLSWTY